MDKIKKYLKLLEENYVEEDIDALNPKDRLAWYLLLKEFEVPKLQRAGFIAGDDNIDKIEVTYKGQPDEPKS